MEMPVCKFRDGVKYWPLNQCSMIKYVEAYPDTSWISVKDGKLSLFIIDHMDNEITVPICGRVVMYPTGEILGFDDGDGFEKYFSTGTDSNDDEPEEVHPKPVKKRTVKVEADHTEGGKYVLLSDYEDTDKLRAAWDRHDALWWWGDDRSWEAPADWYCTCEDPLDCFRVPANWINKKTGFPLKKKR